MQLTARQTSLEPLHTGKGAEGRRPFMSQNHRSGWQPIHERSFGAHDRGSQTLRLPSWS